MTDLTFRNSTHVQAIEDKWTAEDERRRQEFEKQCQQAATARQEEVASAQWLRAAEMAQQRLRAKYDAAVNPKDLAARDEARLQCGLLPPSAKTSVIRVHMLGAKKYGPYNWRDYPILLSGYLDAMERHIDAIRRGIWIDPESGEPHAAHVGCGANIIMDAHAYGTLTDDLKSKDK